ncbi:hypothetical protein [Actinophytocola sp.]|uniref:hypothetical protein n=1 Tax=Actinophytocola sp. TaxID=1872138 RepID=UPI002D3ABF6F|nr:hypothetical protein [Actinophytocola sp.]HYQ66777.1 hypothetical protein [Actinophytocola sp.]
MNAIDTARQAVEIARKLSPAMRDELKSSDRMTTRPANTWRALARRGLVTENSPTRPGRPNFFELTNLGRVVRTVLVDGEDVVLTRAGREQAELHIAMSRDIVISEGAAFAAGETDPATVAFRAALLDVLHERARIEYDAFLLGREAAQVEIAHNPPTHELTLLATKPAYVTPWDQGYRGTLMEELHTRALADRAREQSDALFATGADEVAVGQILDVIRPAELTPAIAAMRDAVMDELHGRAIELYAAHLDPAAPAAPLATAEQRSSGVESFPTRRVPYWIIPAEGTRLDDRHDILGPYNTDDLAEHVATNYRAEGIACDVIPSATRPAPRPA